jgi:hypothetical protein
VRVGVAADELGRGGGTVGVVVPEGAAAGVGDVTVDSTEGVAGGAARAADGRARVQPG